MQKQLTISLLLALTLFLSYRLYVASSTQAELRRALSERSAELASARQALALRDKQLADLQRVRASEAGTSTDSSVTPTSASPSAEHEVAPVKHKRSDKPSAQDQDYASFEITSELSALDKLVSVTPEQREQFRRSLQIEYGLAKGERESLAEILGPETMQQYRQAQQEFRIKAREEMLESEVFRLSRQLTLNAQQEQQVRSLLRQGREQFFPLEEEETEDKPASNPRQRLRDRTREILARESQRQKYNAQALREVLNDQQYNAFLELQATSAATRSHESFLDTAEKEEEQKN